MRTIALLLILFFAVPRIVSASGVVRLLPGRVFAGPVGLGGENTFSFGVRSGQGIRLIVSQNDSDLKETVSCDGWSGPLVYDSFDGGDESITILAEHRTDCTVVLSAIPGRGAGRWKLTLLEVAAPAASDHARVRAERLSSDAKALTTGVSGALAAALGKAEEASAFWIEAGDREMQAQGEIQLGDILYSLSRYEDAIAFYKKAEVNAQSANASAVGAEADSNRGLCELLVGRVEDARDSLNRALTVWRRLNRSYSLAATTTNAGLLAWQTASFQEALLRLREARDTFHRLGNLQGEALAINNLALVQASLGRPEESLSLLRRSLALQDKTGGKAEPARVKVNIAHLLLALGRPREAVDMMQHSLLQIRDSSDRRLIADTEANLGRARGAIGETQAASELLMAAGTKYEEIGEVRGQAFALHHLGIVLSRTGTVERGIQDLEKARQLRLGAGMADAATESLFEIGRIQEVAGDLPAAQLRFEAVIEETEKLRTHVASEIFRVSYFSTKGIYYEALIDLLMRSGQVGRALEYAERAKARSLTDLVETSANEPGAVAPARLAELLKSRRLLEYQASRIQANENDSSLGQMRNEYDAQLEEYYRIENEVKASDPGYSALIQSPPLSASEISEQVPSGSVLFEYWTGSKRSYLWVVTKAGITPFLLASRAGTRPQPSQPTRSPETGNQPRSTARRLR